MNCTVRLRNCFLVTCCQGKLRELAKKQLAKPTAQFIFFSFPNKFMLGFFQLVDLQPPVEGLTQTGITEKMLKGCDPPIALPLFPLQTIELFTGVL